MKKYFSRIVANHWCAKNKLEAAAHKVAYEMDRRIVVEDQVLNYKAEFIDKIARINAEHPRCKPLHLSIENSYYKGDIVFSVAGVFHLWLFLAAE